MYHVFKVITFTQDYQAEESFNSNQDPSMARANLNKVKNFMTTATSKYKSKRPIICDN